MGKSQSGRSCKTFRFFSAPELRDRCESQFLLTLSFITYRKISQDLELQKMKIKKYSNLTSQINKINQNLAGWDMELEPISMQAELQSMEDANSVSEMTHSKPKLSETLDSLENTLKYKMYINKKLDENEKCKACYQEHECQFETSCMGKCLEFCPLGTKFCDMEENMTKFEPYSIKYSATNLNFFDKLDQPDRKCYKLAENIIQEQALNSTTIKWLEFLLDELKTYQPVQKSGMSYSGKCKLDPIKCNRNVKGYGRHTPEILLKHGMHLANLTDFTEYEQLVDALIIDNYENDEKILGRRKRFRILPEKRTNLNEVVMPFTKNSKTKIPNIYHTIWFSDGYSDARDFSLLHFTTIVSFLTNAKQAKKLFFHTDVREHLETNALFQLLLCLGDSRFQVVDVRPTFRVFTNLTDRSKYMEFSHIYHQADFYRIMILIQFGGVYMDDDIFILRDLDEEILNLDVPTLSEESCIAYANGFIVSPPKAKFLLRFFTQYFDGKWRPQQYGENSVIKLWALRKFLPS